MLKLTINVPITFMELGTDVDYDQYFYQCGFATKDVAVLEIGDYTIEMYLLGEQVVYGEDEDRIHRNPCRFISLVRNKHLNPVFEQECHMAIQIKKDKKKVVHDSFSEGFVFFDSILDVLKMFPNEEQIETFLKGQK